jgi:hypothetical protein
MHRQCHMVLTAMVHVHSDELVLLVTNLVRDLFPYLILLLLGFVGGIFLVLCLTTSLALALAIALGDVPMSPSFWSSLSYPLSTLSSTKHGHNLLIVGRLGPPLPLQF